MHLLPCCHILRVMLMHNTHHLLYNAQYAPLFFHSCYLMTTLSNAYCNNNNISDAFGTVLEKDNTLGPMLKRLNSGRRQPSAHGRHLLSTASASAPSKIIKVKRKCGLCKERGHNHKTCPKRKYTEDEILQLKRDAEMIDDRRIKRTSAIFINRNLALKKALLRRPRGHYLTEHGIKKRRTTSSSTSDKEAAVGGGSGDEDACSEECDDDIFYESEERDDTESKEHGDVHNSSDDEYYSSSSESDVVVGTHSTMSTIAVEGPLATDLLRDLARKCYETYQTAFDDDEDDDDFEQLW